MRDTLVPGRTPAQAAGDQRSEGDEGDQAVADADLSGEPQQTDRPAKLRQLVQACPRNTEVLQ